MNKFFLVLGHTYWTRLKSKAFIITTIIMLVFVIGVANIDSIIKLFDSDEEVSEVIVIDEAPVIYTGLENSLENDKKISLIDYDKDIEAGKKSIENEDYDALLILKEDKNSLPDATYYTDSVTSDQVQSTLEANLQMIKDSILIEQAEIDEATLEKMNEPVNLEKLAVDESAKTEEELNIARGIVYVMIFILYMAVIIYGQMIATDVATEKSSRVMEILISSASPVTHMFAKIIGIALLGLTQMILFFIVGYSLISSKVNTLSGEFFEVFGFAEGSISIYLYAILFFILGYFLYATIAAMLGSLVSRVEDVQQLLMPMVMLIVVAFIIAMVGLGMPEAKFITITSYIPFFTPMIMFLRVGMLDVPIWEVIISVGLLVGTIIILAILGARIYRGGVLMYGPSRSLKDFKKALMLTKKEK